MSTITPFLFHYAKDNQLDRWAAGFSFGGLEIRHQIIVDDKTPFEVQVANAFIRASKDLKAHYDEIL